MGYKLKRIMMRPNGVEKQVRPKTYPREILNTTICYYPFGDNQNDATGKTSLDTAGTQVTGGYNFTGTDSVAYATHGNDGSIFCSYWIKVNSAFPTQNYYDTCGVGYTDYGKWAYSVSHAAYLTSNKVSFYNGSRWYNSPKLGTQGQRMHLAYGFNGTQAYYYKNGVKTVLLTTSTTGHGNDGGYLIYMTQYTSRYNYDLTLAHYIIDTVDRESDIVAAYNATCEDYGLSPVS